MSLPYRKEIDGLRAIAVLAVVFYHAGLAGFSGGYVGVDVFFVISGYLITSIILVEKTAGTFQLAGFYERRARRILPALLLVSFSCVPLAWFWMPPGQLNDFAESIVGVSLFLSNFLFWKESGYFAANAAEMPLLHTWSLGIEEQYYLVFPLLLGLFWMLGPRKLAGLIAAIAAASLASAIWGWTFDPAADFYLMPSRAWELLAGSLLAFLNARRPMADCVPALPRELLALSGLTAVGISVAAFDETTPFPGSYTLLPVLGTWLAVAFATTDTLAGRLLAWRGFVGIGLISYSLYLWHHMLFAFARLRSLGEPELHTYLGLSVVALVLAYVSWRYVEQPFRDRRRFTRRQIFNTAAMASVAMLAIGLAGTLFDGFPGRLSEAEQRATNPPRSDDSRCAWQQPLLDFPDIRICQFGSPMGRRPLILWGDSHAGAMLDVAGKEFAARDIPGWFVVNDYCRPIVGTYDQETANASNATACRGAQGALLKHLKNTDIRAILIVIRWTFQLYPVVGRIDTLTFDNGEGGREAASYRVYFAEDGAGRFVTFGDAKARAIKGFIAGFEQIGVPVIVQYPIPEPGWNVPNLNFKHLLASGAPPSTISTSQQLFLDRNDFVIDVLDSLDGPSIRRVRPDRILCDNSLAGRCIAQWNGVPLYFDDDHLSADGVSLIIGDVLGQIPP